MKYISSKIIALCLMLAIAAFSFSFYGVYTKLALMEQERENYRLAITEYNATVNGLKSQLLKAVNIANTNADVAVKPMSDKEKSQKLVKIRIKKEGSLDDNVNDDDFNLTRELNRMWTESTRSKKPGF